MSKTKNQTLTSFWYISILYSHFCKLLLITHSIPWVFFPIGQNCGPVNYYMVAVKHFLWIGVIVLPEDCLFLWELLTSVFCTERMSSFFFLLFALRNNKTKSTWSLKFCSLGYSDFFFTLLRTAVHFDFEQTHGFWIGRPSERIEFAVNKLHTFICLRYWEKNRIAWGAANQKNQPQEEYFPSHYLEE